MSEAPKNLSLRKLSEGADARFPKGSVARKAMYSVEYSMIKPSKTFNPRKLKRPKIQAHIQSIFESIMASDKIDDVIPPLELCYNERGEIDITDGYCRYTAIGMAIKKGKQIGPIPAFEGTNDPSRRLLKALKFGKGAPLEPLETAIGYARLIDDPEMVDGTGARWTIETLAADQGVTTESVKQLLILGRAPKRVQQYVEDEHIAAHPAIEVLRKHGDNAEAVIKAEWEKAQARGENKVTKGSIEGRAIPKRVVIGMVDTINDFSRKLSRDVRLQLATFEKLPPEQLVGKTIEIDAAAMLDLMRIKHELDQDAKRKDVKDRKKKEKASQAKLEV